MDKIMEKLNKLSLPIVILISSIILGGFFYASQVNKQRSIEKQQRVKIEHEKEIACIKNPSCYDAQRRKSLEEIFN